MGLFSFLGGKKAAQAPEPAPPDSIAELAADVASPHGGARIDAVRALLDRWREGDGEAAQALAPSVHELLADPEPVVRQLALQAVQLFRKPENLERCASGVLAALLDPAPEVRTSAVWAAIALGSEQALAQVRALLDSREEPMRFAAACALAHVKDAAAIPELVRAMHEGHRRQEAVSALIALGDASCLPDLRRLFDAEEDGALEPFDRTLVAAALARFGDPAGAAHLALRIERGGDDRPMAVEWAARLRVEDVLPALERLVDEEGDPARGAALRALGVLRAPGAEERLRAVAASDDTADDLRMDAAEGLAELGTPGALALLEQLAQDDTELAALCRELLAQVAARGAGPPP